MFRTLLGALLCAVATTTLVAAPPAVAAGTGDPVLQAPVNGTSIKEYDGVVRVDFSDAPAGTYTATLTTSAGPAKQQVTTDDTTTVHEFQFGRVYWPTRVDVQVALDGDPATSSSGTLTVTGYAQPKLLSPEPGTLQVGWDGEVRLDFTGAAPGYWNVSVRDDDFDYWHQTQVYYPGTGPAPAIDFPAPTDDGRLRVDVSESGGSHYWRSYYFEHAVPVRVSGVSASVEELYSTVKDGFRDKTTVRFDLSRPADVVVRVRDKDGRVRYSRDLGSLPARDHRFTWKGQAGSGGQLPVGRYRMTFEARTAAGATGEATQRLEVVSDTVADRRTVTVKGTQTSRRSKAGSCFIDGYAGSLRLDCWGGHHAEATYAFALPENARKFSWRVRGENWCCDIGRLTRTGRQVAERRYAVTVRVTQWRAYEIHRVSLTYTYDRRR